MFGVSKLYEVDQLWTHISEDGREWVCCRVAKDSNHEDVKHPQHTINSRLIASANLKVSILDNIPLQDLLVHAHEQVERINKLLKGIKELKEV